MPAGKDSSLAIGDPLIGSSFGIEIEGKLSGFFKEASGVESSNEVVTLEENDAKGKKIVRKIPGNLKWGDIVLKRGITTNMDMWTWRDEVVQGNIKTARKNGSLMMYDHEGKEIARWNFEAAWPSKISGPSMNAGGNEVGVEEITLVHEGIKRVT